LKKKQATKTSFEIESNKKKEKKMEKKSEKQHFILVHGACHGAWSWYKLNTLLTSAGHRVTALDLSASGVNPIRFQDVHTFAKYSQPLMDLMASLPPEEKVILVGHSLGGVNLALAMDAFPEKVLVAVFLTAFMPDSSSPPSHVLNMYLKRVPLENFVDTQFSCDPAAENPLTSMFFGPKFLSEKLYQLSPLEDLTLAKTLIRISSMFVEDLSKAPNFSAKRYGSVSRVFIVCTEDQGIPEHFQRWMIDNYPVNEVKVIEGSDHMPMLSKPRELCQCLLDIAGTYS